MKVAICGYPPYAAQIIDGLKNSGIECTHIIKDLVSSHGEKNFNLNSLIPSSSAFINFFEFRKLILQEKLDGVIIFENILLPFVKNIIKIFKLYDIPKIGVKTFGSPLGEIYWLDSDKVYIPYMETNLIDSCNLNCKACTHYANLFNDNDFYAIENFKRDIRQVSENVDVIVFRLLGGEPLKLKNIDSYVKISRKFLPKSYIRLVTNGLLVPNMPESFFKILRESNCVLDISLYLPTIKMLNKIETTLKENKVLYQFCTGKIENFNSFLSLKNGHNPLKSRVSCHSDDCRFLRDGKIYKCSVDALSFKLVEHFGIKNFPKAAGIDIFSKNFPALVQELDGNIELCTWCNETSRQIDWAPSNNPKLTDWLADPTEIQLLE